MKYLFFIILVNNSIAQAMTIKYIELGGKRIKVEVADNEKARQQGLMFRKQKLKEDSGMLFVFAEQRVLSFWMKNTFIPLSIGYFNQDKRLVDIKKMQPVVSEMQIQTPAYASRVPAKYALEMDQGWFQRNKVIKGFKFRFVSKKD